MNPMSDQLDIEVFDHDLMGGDDSLGKGVVRFNDLVQGQEKHTTVHLTGGAVGENLMGMVQNNALGAITGMFGKKKPSSSGGAGMKPISNKGVLELGVTAVDFSKFFFFFVYIY